MPTSDYDELIGAEVVVDIEAPAIYIGKLVAVNETFLVLEDADVHVLAGTTSSKEVYAMETRRNGVQPTRQRVHVKADHVISVSRLDEVIVY